MFRNFLLVILAFIVLGTAQVDAQLIRRLRSAVRGQIDQQRNQQQRLSQSQNGTQTPNQQGSAPKQNGAVQPTQAKPGQEFSAFIDRITGRAIQRFAPQQPNQKSVTPKLANENEPARPRPTGSKSVVGQFDIARQATKQSGAVELKGPEPNPTVKKESTVSPAPKNESPSNALPDRMTAKKPASILNSKTSSTTEPEKPKPTVSVLEFNGPDKGK